MSTITRSVTIDATPEETWNIVKDFGGVHRWHPVVEDSPLLSQNNEGLGAKRRCEFYDKTSVVEEIIEYDEARRFLEVALTEFSMPLTSATAILQVESLEGGRSAVRMTMEFEVKYGPIGWVMDRAMMGKMFSKVLAGLQTHVETGQLIGEGGQIEAVPAVA